MRRAARSVLTFLAFGLMTALSGAAPAQAPAGTAQAPATQTTPPAAPVAVQPAPPPPTSPGMVEGILAQSSSQLGYMDAQQVKALLDQTRFAEFRINDLLTDVHPERWKISDTARASFGQTVETLRAQLKALDGWRQRFAARPESSYASFETYATIGTILPRLEGVAKTVSQAENPSFGAQFFEANDRLFDLQQKLTPYVGFLLNNQDSVAQALESNLAGCQNQLGYAMHGQSERPKLIRNSAPVRAHRTRVRPRAKDDANQ